MRHVSEFSCHAKGCRQAIDHVRAPCDADLVLAEHKHWLTDPTVGHVRVGNVGSISVTRAPDPRASYELLQAESDGYRIELR